MNGKIENAERQRDRPFNSASGSLPVRKMNFARRVLKKFKSRVKWKVLYHENNIRQQLSTRVQVA